MPTCLIYSENLYNNSTNVIMTTYFTDDTVKRLLQKIPKKSKRIKDMGRSQQSILWQ